MFEQMKWDEVYTLWNYGSCLFPEILFSPITAESVYVKYSQDGYIYGFDWLQNEDVQERKKLIERAPMEFLYFTKPTNKGTIQTAEMLVNAQSEEEIAAIWIAATSKELSGYGCGNSIGGYAYMLHIAACSFLRPRYSLWHHAMKRLVPEILIPMSVIKNIDCKSAETVMGLIQMNTVMLKSTWSILKYSSLKDGEFQNHVTV